MEWKDLVNLFDGLEKFIELIHPQMTWYDEDKIKSKFDFDQYV